MANDFSVSIVTPEKIFFEGKTTSLVVPAELGYLGLLAHHTPLVASLRSGKLSMKDASGKLRTFICRGGGFMEFSKNTATILLDSINDQ